MSSFSISASGSRSYTITGNNDQATNLSTPSKADDNIHVQLNAKQTRVLIPVNSRLERIKRGKSEYLRLVMPGSFTMFSDATVEDVPGTFPHMFVNAGKHLTDYYNDEEVEVVEVIHERVGDLIPPTDEK